MKSSIKALATGATALVAAGALLVGGAGVAFAATPPYEPDTTNQLGTLMFYDAAGNQVTSGSITSDPFSKFVVASTDDPSGVDTSAALYGYLPQNGVVPGNWSGEQLSGTTNFPVASPAYIAGAGAHRPVVTNGTGDTKLSDLMADFPHPSGDTGTAYDGLYQLRLLTASNTKWWAADIQITGSTWQLVYPSLASTTTTLAASPASPQVLNPAGSTPGTVTLTSTVSGGAAGAVQFYRNGSALGSPVTVSSGTATKTDVPAGPTAAGGPVTTTYSATFTPSAGTAATVSSSSPVSYVVQNKAGDATSTSLSVTQTGFVGDPVTFTSAVTDTVTPSSVPVGSVEWFDNGSSVAGPVAVSGSGQATATLTSGFATAGNHSVVAKFTPADPTQFAASQSQASNFAQIDKSSPCADTQSQCTDTAAFKVTVNAGTLVISTPYDGSDAAHTFDLGTMTLDPTGTYLHTAAPFGTATDPTKGVTISDRRAGDLPWNASVTADDFVSGANKINAENLGFQGVQPSYVGGDALNPTTKPVVAYDVPNGGTANVYSVSHAGTNGLKGGPHQFASAAHGTGSVYVIGSMDLYAPTSTPAGTYTTTVTFTIA